MDGIHQDIFALVSLMEAGLCALVVYVSVFSCFFCVYNAIYLIILSSILEKTHSQFKYVVNTNELIAT